MNSLFISPGNKKLGKKSTWNINLPPHLTCMNRKCFTEGCCYNLKAWRLFPTVKISWVKNWLFYIENSTKYFDEIINKIHRAKKLPEFFRWHASGDIPNQAYFDGMKRVAYICSEVKFLVFTKNFDLIFKGIPKNLEIIISAWPGVKLPPHLRRRFPIAWFIDGRETRKTTKKVVDCPGKCDECRICWNLSERKKHVAFHKH